MRVFMLGWEFPPFISGGLGTACYGLTKALSRRQAQIIFVLPKSIGTEYSAHVKLLSPQSPQAAAGDRSPQSVASVYQLDPSLDPAEFTNVSFKAVPSRMISPYQSAGGVLRHAMATSGDTPDTPGSPGSPGTPTPPGSPGSPGSPNAVDAMIESLTGLVRGAHPGGTGSIDYHGDLIGEAQRFAELCVDLARGEDFDVIHAHDWMTYPAGLAVARMTGKPLVVHVHSTEFDRAGEHPNQLVYDIERRGLHGAIGVIAVSYLTKSIVQHRYGVPSDKIRVVYNGIDNGQLVGAPQDKRAAIKRGDKIVLFLGRITMQKGPEYFVGAAKKVLQKIERVKFVMAGSGDKVRDVIEMAAAEGIGHRVLFTGFLRGRDVERVFDMADVYVMPSVSEPFGIAPLEAIRHDVPVIISKTSGVAEVLTHALKVDFWDIEEIANKIIAVLRHPPLGDTLRQQADIEVRRLTWDDAAAKCMAAYEHAVQLMPQ